MDNSCFNAIVHSIRVGHDRLISISQGGGLRHYIDRVKYQLLMDMVGDHSGAFLDGMVVETIRDNNLCEDVLKGRILILNKKGLEEIK